MKTPVNINKDNIKNSDFLLLYINILLFHERHLKGNSGYDVRSKSIKDFKDKYGLVLKKMDTGSIASNSNANITGNYLFFTDTKNNQVVSIFYHLRNSIAHGKFTKKKIGRHNFILFEDQQNGGRCTMKGQIGLSKLEEFIYSLYKSNKSKRK